MEETQPTRGAQDAAWLRSRRAWLALAPAGTQRALLQAAEILLESTLQLDWSLPRRGVLSPAEPTPLPVWPSVQSTWTHAVWGTQVTLHVHRLFVRALLGRLLFEKGIVASFVPSASREEADHALSSDALGMLHYLAARISAEVLGPSWVMGPVMQREASSASQGDVQSSSELPASEQSSSVQSASGLEEGPCDPQNQGEAPRGAHVERGLLRAAWSTQIKGEAPRFQGAGRAEAGVKSMEVPCTLVVAWGHRVPTSARDESSRGSRGSRRGPLPRDEACSERPLTRATAHGATMAASLATPVASSSVASSGAEPLPVLMSVQLARGCCSLRVVRQLESGDLLSFSLEERPALLDERPAARQGDPHVDATGDEDEDEDEPALAWLVPCPRAEDLPAWDLPRGAPEAGIPAVSAFPDGAQTPLASWVVRIAGRSMRLVGRSGASSPALRGGESSRGRNAMHEEGSAKEAKRPGHDAVEAAAGAATPEARETTVAVDDLPLTLCVELARIPLTVASLQQLREGDTLAWMGPVGREVRLRVGDCVVAHGMLVDVDGGLGVCITETLVGP